MIVMLDTSVYCNLTNELRELVTIYVCDSTVYRVITE